MPNIKYLLLFCFILVFVIPIGLTALLYVFNPYAPTDNYVLFFFVVAAFAGLVIVICSRLK